MSQPNYSPAAGESSVSGTRTATTSYSTLGQALNPQSTRTRGNRQPAYNPGQQNPQNYPPGMTSDGRYMYQQPQEPVQPSYAYPNYTAPPYDAAAQFTSNQPRPVRSNPSHSPHQPPPAQPYNPPAPAYPPQATYAAPPYPVPPSQVAHWTPEGWSHYPPPYPPPNPPAPAQDSQNYTNHASGRPEASPPVPVEHRGQTIPPKSEARREERPPRPVDATPPASTRRPDPPATPSAPPPSSLGLDYAKLIESYRIIIDSSDTWANDSSDGRSSTSAEALERMVQAAAYGAQALDAASKRLVSEVPRENGKRASDASESDSGKPAQEPASTEGQTCLGCRATSTPEWRRGPMGPRTLCNACGLVYAKLIKKRTREPGRSRGSHSARHGSRNENGQGSSSDDDDSFESQERQSEQGDHGGRD